MATRLFCGMSPVLPELERLLEAARHHVMTPAEREAQRRSWVIGELMIEDDSLSREEAERRYDRAKRELGT